MSSRLCDYGPDLEESAADVVNTNLSKVQRGVHAVQNERQGTSHAIPRDITHMTLLNTMDAERNEQGGDGHDPCDVDRSHC
eukprot:2452520-Rhodomonas_salina.1